MFTSVYYFMLTMRQPTEYNDVIQNKHIKEYSM